MTNILIEYEFTGEFRSPMAGEWFYTGRYPEQARFDFEATKFHILKQLVFEEVL